MWHTSWFNLAPRLGAAWLIHDKPGKELVLRGGGGVFFDTGNSSTLGAFNGVGFTAARQESGISLPVASSQFNFSTNATEPSRATGDYTFVVLDPGDYKVTGMMTAFQSQTQSGVHLDAAQNVHVNFTLQVGEASQNVTVEAGTTLVDRADLSTLSTLSTLS